MYNTVFIIYLDYAIDFHLFLFFCTAWFLLVKNTRKILRKISYNRNPVKQEGTEVKRYLVVLSDGIHFVQGFVSPSCNWIITKLTVNNIVQITGYRI
jgi:hypothetical protein